MPLDPSTFHAALSFAREKLLACRVTDGHWEGHLSGSALSTATAACALELFRRAAPNEYDSDLAAVVREALEWIASHQNDDGGWGDTIDSLSNISTTVLCWAAMNVDENTSDAVRSAEASAKAWIQQAAGGTSPKHLTDAIETVYGDDRTFAVPILTMCALSGRFGTGRNAWCHVKVLPFELAACPHQLFRWLRLSVVSYALPALIAMGQVRHHHRPTRNPLTRILRNATKGVTLRVLESIQPTSGGFLEAAPLTSFVLMSLASMGQANHPVARRAAAFLTATVRDDGSWPIDTNLATWLTTLSINALAGDGELVVACPAEDRTPMMRWLREQQYSTVHPYTHAAPGGWAWTNLSGGVPDADDTAGAILALHHLHQADFPSEQPSEDLVREAAAGIEWLVNLQNSDGGIPTFCRGWGKLPFDQSSPDLTAHALRAFAAWHEYLPSILHDRVTRSISASLGYLLTVQRDNGSFIPLWFGNQAAPGQENPVYGTSRVLCVGTRLKIETTPDHPQSKRRSPDQLGELRNATEPQASVCAASPTQARIRFVIGDDALFAQWQQSRSRAIRYLLGAQGEDGGWGGAPSTPPSIEETAIAVEAMTVALEADRVVNGTREPQQDALADEMLVAIRRGASWLIENTNAGTAFKPAPIGLYFAKLWYSERLYPLIFTVAAWERSRQVLFDITARAKP